MKDELSCVSIAPSSTANLGPGFDTFGLAIDLFNDQVKITKKESQNNQISIVKIEHNKEEIPVNIENNSAGLVVKKMLRDFEIKNDVDIEIIKGVPAGYGLGSSAASSVAAACAVKKLFNLKINLNKLVDYAGEGEIASASIKHYDNVASSMLGGFVIVRAFPSLELIKFEPPENLNLIIGIPKIPIPKKKTEAARNILPSNVSLENTINNISNASTIVAGFAKKDIDMIARGIVDRIVEPVRKKQIPGFDQVKKYAIDSGALAVTISGAGPSIVSILKTDRDAERIMKAIKTGFAESKIESSVYLCRPSKGASIIDAE